MKVQSTVEFYVILSVVVIAVISFSFFLYKNYYSDISNERNITINNINIVNFNLYFMPSANVLTGSFYQNGGKAFSNGVIQIRLNNSAYSIPVSFVYYNSPVTTYEVDFKSSELNTNVLKSIYIGEPYILAGIVFINSSKDYIYYDNYSSVIYSK